MPLRQEIVDEAEQQQVTEEASPWEGMVRIALMRMMADEVCRVQWFRFTV